MACRCHRGVELERTAACSSPSSSPHGNRRYYDCPHCRSDDGTPEVCGSDGQGYYNECYAQCFGATVRYSTLCVVPACACIPGYEGDGQVCTVLPPTDAPPPTTSQPRPTSTEQPLQPTYEFLMNGTFADVVLSRRMMLDGKFAWLTRVAVVEAAGIGDDVAGGLSLTVRPSERMPGLILVDIRSVARAAAAAPLRFPVSVVDSGRRAARHVAVAAVPNRGRPTPCCSLCRRGLTAGSPLVSSADTTSSSSSTRSRLQSRLAT